MYTKMIYIVYRKRRDYDTANPTTRITNNDFSRKT